MASSMSACTCISAVPSATGPLLPLSSAPSVALVALVAGGAVAPFSSNQQTTKRIHRHQGQCAKRHQSSCLYIGGKWLLFLYIGSGLVDVPVHPRTCQYQNSNANSTILPITPAGGT